jgi:glyoxylase-like metal-dependent hydrolase (beta-lactamase superfamily II)
MTSDPREHRRALVFLETAFQQLETATALGRDPREARALVDKALAKPALDDADRAQARERLASLARPDERAQYVVKHGLGGARMWTSSGGARFFRVVTESFPRHVNYVYFLEINNTKSGTQLVMWDCGSGLHSARKMIEDGMALIDIAYGKKIEARDIDVILVSHGHYDHFGDAKHWKAASGAPLWIHELDARVLENFQERTVLTGRDMAVFLAGAGCVDDDVRSLVEMYLASKEMYSSVPVDRRLRHEQLLFDGRARVIHTAGHCPGHICLRVDDVLLVADQVLAPVTPHLSPQSLNANNGLDRYLTGIGRLVLEDGVKHVLPAHYDEIPDLHARIREIAEDHVVKLQQTIAATKSGATVADVSAALFGKLDGYNVLLGLLEAGTHVEYLHQLGALAVDDLDALVKNPRLPFRYRATDVDVHVVGSRVALGGG